ncbi:hypothetical protein [Photobacterium indicum]|nr:hypothetical protein [Photobacterium indicum]
MNARRLRKEIRETLDYLENTENITDNELRNLLYNLNVIYMNGAYLLGKDSHVIICYKVAVSIIKNSRGNIFNIVSLRIFLNSERTCKDHIYYMAYGQNL